MTVESAYEGEDVPITATFDDGGTDPDDTGTDGTGDASITITANADGTEMVSAAAMTRLSTGVYEYVWDTAADTGGKGVYVLEVTAEFGGETKLVRDSIRLQ